MSNKNWDQIESVQELAERLWSFEALELPPQRFVDLADRVWKGSPGPQALWKLGGAMNDFLRRHPDTITVPAKLPWLLLVSPRCDPRIVGLKLLKHIRISDERLLKEVLKALQRRREYERCGGIHELHLFIDQLAQRRVRKRTPAVIAVMRRLSELARRSRYAEERECAGRMLGHLEELLG
jgi:hypothetical protein